MIFGFFNEGTPLDEQEYCYNYQEPAFCKEDLMIRVPRQKQPIVAPSSSRSVLGSLMFTA